MLLLRGWSAVPPPVLVVSFAKHTATGGARAGQKGKCTQSVQGKYTPLYRANEGPASLPWASLMQVIV